MINSTSIFIFKEIANAVLSKGAGMFFEKILDKVSYSNLQSYFEKAIKKYSDANSISVEEVERLIVSSNIQLFADKAPKQVREVFDIFVKLVSKNEKLSNELELKIGSKSLELLQKVANNTDDISAQLAITNKFTETFVDKSGLPADIRKSSKVSEIPNKSNPHIVFRENIIDELKSMLKGCRLIILHGGKKVGKSTIAEQLYSSANNDGMMPIFIDIKYSNSINVIEQIEREETNKHLFIIDNIDTRTINDYALRLIKHILSNKDKNQYIIIGTDKLDLEQVPFSTEGVSDYLVPDLSDDEIMQIASSYEMPNISKMLPFLKSHGTHPLVIRWVCAYCQKNNWKVTRDALSNIIAYKGEDVQYKTSQIVDNEIKDEYTKELLARMILIGSIVTDSELSVVADVEVPITGYKYKIAQVIPTWVTLKDGIYMLSDILKLWDYGLPMKVRRACYSAVARDLLKHHELISLQVAQVIQYLACAGEYDFAARILIWAIDMYSKHKEELKDTLFIAFWLDLPLPNEMSLGYKFNVRFMQYMYLDLSLDKKRYIITDVYSMVKSSRADVQIKSVALPFLIMAFAQLDDIGKSIECYSENEQLVLPANEQTEVLLEQRTKLKEMDNQYFQLLLYQSDEINSFRQWVISRSKTPSLSSCLVFVEHLINKMLISKVDWTSLKDQLFEFMVEAEKGADTENLVIILVSTLIRVKGRMLGDMNGARALYDEYSSKLYSPACKKCIIEEFAYVCYVNGLVVDSMTYIQKAENIQSDEVPQIIKIRVYLIKSYLKARTDYEEAKKEASKMLPYLYNADIDKPTKAKYFGEIAIAYWNIGDIHSAINFINLSLSYSLKSYEQYPEEEDTKFIIRKIGMCMSQWAHKKKNGKYEEKMAIPKPGLFTEHYEKGLISDFSDKMVICIVAEMYVASSKILSSKEALEWAKIMVDKMQKFPTELNNFNPPFY